MKKLLIFIGVLIVAIPLVMWWTSPGQQVKRKTKHLMDVLSLAEGAGGPLRQAKVFSMNGILANEVKVSAPEIDDANGFFDKQEMESIFSWICQNAKGSDFQIVEYQSVEVSGEEAEAVVLVDGYMEVAGYRPVDGSYKATISWRKGEGGWRFYEVIWETF